MGPLARRRHQAALQKTEETPTNDSVHASTSSTRRRKSPASAAHRPDRSGGGSYLESLRAALAANQQLQVQVLRELESLSEKAAYHRNILLKRRERVSMEMSQFGEPNRDEAAAFIPRGITKSIPTESKILELLSSDKENSLKRKMICSGSQAQESIEADNGDDDDSNSSTRGDDNEEDDFLTTYTMARSPTKMNACKRRKTSTSTEKDGDVSVSWTSHRRKAFCYDPYRRWNRAFFTDPSGSIPAPNTDLIFRNELMSKSFFHHITPPWSKRQLDVLRDVTGKLKVSIAESDGCEQDTSNDEPSEPNSSIYDGINFDEVAQKFATDHAPLRDTAIPTTARGRTPFECKIAYMHLLSKPPKLNKQESLFILEQVHMAEESVVPDWNAIATALNEYLGSDGPKWTAFNCCNKFHAELRPNSANLFTESEDELLLKYIAAMGPQFVLDMANATQLGYRLFPSKPSKQLLHRASYTILNPKATTEPWSDEEERKLALCMKVYADLADASTNMGITASHHFPRRSPPSVTFKWTDRLSPEYTWRPFTNDEDATILKMVSEEGGRQMFSELVRKHLPSRHPTAVFRRWEKLATPEDMANMYGNIALKKGARAGAVGDDMLLQQDDFVLQLKTEDQSI